MHNSQADQVLPHPVAAPRSPRKTTTDDSFVDCNKLPAPTVDSFAECNELVAPKSRTNRGKNAKNNKSFKSAVNQQVYHATDFL